MFLFLLLFIIIFIFEIYHLHSLSEYTYKEQRYFLVAAVKIRSSIKTIFMH